VARPRGVTWPSGWSGIFGNAGDVLRRWSTTDVAAGRLMPWLPIAFGLGVVIYFTAEREPALWSAAAVAIALAIAAFLARRRPVAFPLMLGLAAVATGFAAITFKSVRIAHPILQHAAWNISIS